MPHESVAAAAFLEKLKRSVRRREVTRKHVSALPVFFLRRRPKQSYLDKVTDPWCTRSRNATWEKVIPAKNWVNVLTRHGYSGASDSTSVFDFSQSSRVQDYVTGTFRLPFSRIRSELDLRSAWFSVKAEGDSIRLTGRGYGHGVGLCQEGAIQMAAKGYGYNDIITFYYPGVKILDIGSAKKSEDDKVTPKN